MSSYFSVIVALAVPLAQLLLRTIQISGYGAGSRLRFGWVISHPYKTCFHGTALRLVTKPKGAHRGQNKRWVNQDQVLGQISIFLAISREVRRKRLVCFVFSAFNLQKFGPLFN
jgi:hypothetical protein